MFFEVHLKDSDDFLIVDSASEFLPLAEIGNIEIDLAEQMQNIEEDD